LPRKDRSLDPAVVSAARDLRVAGLSERAIYEGLRDALERPPSYRDLRAALDRQGVLKRSDATRARRQGDYLAERRVKDRDTGIVYRAPMRSSNYLSRRREALKVDRTPDARERFNRRYILGYLASHQAQPELLTETDGYFEDLESIYEGEGSA